MCVCVWSVIRTGDLMTCVWHWYDFSSWLGGKFQVANQTSYCTWRGAVYMLSYLLNSRVHENQGIGFWTHLTVHFWVSLRYLRICRCAHGPMLPHTKPYVPKDWCVHVLDPMCPRTDVSTHSVRCAHRPMCPRTQPDVPADLHVHVVPTDWCAHALRFMCPRTDASTYRSLVGLGQG